MRIRFHSFILPKIQQQISFFSSVKMGEKGQRNNCFQHASRAETAAVVSLHFNAAHIFKMIKKQHNKYCSKNLHNI